jgi:hypothetical protein
MKESSSEPTKDDMVEQASDVIHRPVFDLKSFAAMRKLARRAIVDANPGDTGRY